MKSIIDIIQEKLKINSKSKVNTTKYHPTTRNELKDLIDKLIQERGNNADLNDIDVSNITDMRGLFSKYDFYSNASSEIEINELYKFNGDISEWDVSNVISMREMFRQSEYTGENGDISNWNVEKVEDMWQMFYRSKYNGDISKWNPKSIKKNWYMFVESPLGNNKPKWYKQI